MERRQYLELMANRQRRARGWFSTALVTRPPTHRHVGSAARAVRSWPGGSTRGRGCGALKGARCLLAWPIRRPLPRRGGAQTAEDVIEGIEGVDLKSYFSSQKAAPHGANLSGNSQPSKRAWRQQARAPAGGTQVPTRRAGLAPPRRRARGRNCIA
jgi:hypothetical protein